LAENNIEDLNLSLEDVNNSLGEMLTELDRVNLGFSSITGAMAGKYAKNLKYFEKMIKASSLVTSKLSGDAHVMHTNLSKLKTSLKDHDDNLGQHAEAIKEATKSIGDSLTGNLTKGIQEFLETTNYLVNDNLSKINKARFKQTVTNKKTINDQLDSFDEIFKKLNDDIIDSQYNLSKNIIGNKEFEMIRNSWDMNVQRTSNDMMKMVQDIAVDPRRSGLDQLTDALGQFEGMQKIIQQQIENGLITPQAAASFKAVDKRINLYKDQIVEAQNEIGYKQEEMINNLYGGLEGLASGIERKFGGKIGKILFGFDPVVKTLRHRYDQIIERVKKRGRVAAEDIGDAMKAAAQATGKILTKVATNMPIIIGVAVGAAFMMIGSQMKGFFDQAIGMAESSWETLTGRMRENIDALKMSVSQGGEMANALNTRFVDGLEVSWGDVAKAMAGIKDIQGDMVGLGAKQAKLITKLSVGLGASAESAASFYNMMKNSIGGSDKVAANAGMMVSQFSKILGMSPEDIFKDLEESSEFLMKHTKSVGKDMIKTVMEAKKLGMKLSDVAKITQSMFDYESSIQNELEASLLLGRSIDLNRARQLMFNKQTESGMKELASMMGTYEDFQNMNFVQQEGLAKAFGMNSIEYSKILKDQQRMNSLTDVQRKQLEGINKQREKMNDLQGESYLNAEKAKLAQESMKQSWDDMTTDLGAQFIPIMVQYKGIMMTLMKTLLPSLINGFSFLVDKIITPISNFFNSKDGENFMKTINKEVGLIFTSMGELFDEVKKVLNELFGTSPQSISGSASSVIETIGAGIRAVIGGMKWVVANWKKLLIAMVALKSLPLIIAGFKGIKGMFNKQAGLTPGMPMYVNVVNANQIAAVASSKSISPGSTALNSGITQGTDKNGNTYYRDASGKRVSKNMAIAPSSPTSNKPGKNSASSSGKMMAASAALMTLSMGLELFGPENSKTIDAMQTGLMAISGTLALIEVGKLAVTAATWLWNAALYANPLGLIVLAVVAIGAAIVGLIVYWDEVVVAMNWVWEKLYRRLKGNWKILRRYLGRE
jgi:hypothetical protein